ncbi:hypothetical protein [uncultured Parolsenella sp.]|uniref:hypothetical protein n=1 Tax=uncultured Parolsenella sp. TaxID=2083008 RepID=UPI0027D9A3D4|nr:hypothetical protein [uncultured Parolsenella sp.]
MAKTTVRLRRFVPNLAGYTQVKDDGEVQAILQGKADSVRAAADSMLGEPGHRVVQKRAKFDMRYVVGTETAHAFHSQAKHKTLTKACNSIGGGS